MVHVVDVVPQAAVAVTAVVEAAEAVGVVVDVAVVDVARKKAAVALAVSSGVDAILRVPPSHCHFT